MIPGSELENAIAVAIEGLELRRSSHRAHRVGPGMGCMGGGMGGMGTVGMYSMQPGRLPLLLSALQGLGFRVTAP